MVPYFRLISLSCLAAGTCLVASADNSVQLLQNYMKSADLNLVNPASADVVAGGLVVSDGKHASYNPLPAGVSFAPSAPANTSFFAASGGKSFSLAALLSSLGSVLKAGLGVNHSNTTTINQIDATSQSVRAEDVVANADVAKLIKTWIRPNDQKPRYTVYVVIKTMSSKTISISNTNGTGIAGAFGSDLPTCPDASGATGASDASGTSGASLGGSGAAGANGAKGGQGGGGAPVATGSAGSSGAAGAAANSVLSGKPSASLKFCMNSNSKVTLNSANPLIFAVALRPVTVNSDGSLTAGPVSEVVKAGLVNALGEPGLIAVDGRTTHTKPILPAK